HRARDRCYSCDTRDQRAEELAETRRKHGVGVRDSVRSVVMSAPAHPDRGAITSKRRGDTVSVNRTDLVAAIADKAGLTKTDADKALSALQEVLVENLGKGEAVKVPGLLSVERVSRKARTGRNPRTGEEIKIPAGYGVKISAGSA